ncbi:hypothetical protein LH462_11140 [Laribacter hongkongensis]|uniref:Phage tail protein n=1 Tax=Laribacter hongkongensis TaxID=168471 RepID=A0ABD4SUM9_9NEIS|nr:hypothetical protein [Laribacter hongkongensis]MCG9026717.1 hypothetical protein [Laribacter hongkongensis]MCG9101601.1 hypothetical protein [Laribacter hongkongensis]MCG9104273.1 hypothetical protein [Laribacter hongkongensis]MCG9113506.1 hypothetical protein [Laribacter hongkongensis]MCG9119244.1 hypothetical protein [Laribacter hongkongensis]
MISVKLDLDSGSLAALSRGLSVALLGRAAKRAVRKTALWVRTQMLRRMGDDGIRRKLIVHRVRLYDKSWREDGGGGLAVKVWFGVDAINADTLGKPVRSGKGYRVKSWRFESAFVPTRNPRYAGKLYQRTTASRLPIQRAKVEIDEMANDAFALITDRIPGRLHELMLQELNYEWHKLAGRAR